MRAIITISLPQQSSQLLKKRIKRRNFKGVSEYFRFLLDLDDDLITQDQVREYARQADRDYNKGILKRRSSLRELL